MSFERKKSISKRLFITRFEEKLDGVSEADCVSLAQVCWLEKRTSSGTIEGLGNLSSSIIQKGMQTITTYTVNNICQVFVR